MIVLRYSKEFYKFINHLRINKVLIKTLIVNDFKKQYLGSYFGLFWAFAQPIAYIVVIWFVFTFGFRTVSASNGVPFFIWLISGMIPWFFISNAFMSATNAIVANSFLVKKVAFRVSILPLVQIGSALLIHFVLLFALMLALILYGYYPNFYWLQIFYYLFCTVFILLGLSWITSSIRVFIKDIGNFIALLVQIGFWVTPIFWNIDTVPQKYQYLVTLNPAAYIVTGYRDTFLNHVWFWEKPCETIYFLGLSSIFFIVGAVIFRRLRPHFGDVL